MHRFVSSGCFAVLAALILLSATFHVISLRSSPNHPDNERKSAEKESTERASAPSLVSLTPTGEGSYQYDVFLSFSGSDTRKKFTDHLYQRLVNARTMQLRVFRDINSNRIGKEFDSQILNAIARSKISIPIISKNYASRNWCLLELIYMMDYRKNMSHIVLPIFYEVNASDVRHLKGSFGEAFHSQKKHFDKKVIQEGQRALREVSLLQGWESENIFNGHEGALVEEVIRTVQTMLPQDFQLDVTKHIVGISDHVNKIKNWVSTPASDARMIGIYGMEGIGKTTLAKVIYNELSNDFVHRSFLHDIRHHGISYLQNQLFKEILQIEHQVWKVDDGISLIKARFRGKKVLIVLDDVNHKNQLNALARERNWFAAGSVIIVTTSYQAVLDQSEFVVDFKYELNKLDEKHSLLLFNKHAFRMDHSPRDFESISHDIISIMDGLPLALEAVGSYLYGKTDRGVWEDVLEKLRKEPHEDVQEKLKISYDALELGHKQIFLDIACLSIVEQIKFAMYTWKDCGFSPNQAIEELKLRCLIKIDEDGKLRMHNQLRIFGRNIIRREGPLGERSRLCASEEAFRVLMDKKGTERIGAIHLDQQHGQLQTYTSKHFGNMRSLRFLQLRRASLSGGFNDLFLELRWLRWFDIESNLFFSWWTDLYLPNLRTLEVSFDQKTRYWTGWSSIKTAKGLKVFYLEHHNYLRRTPDLSAFIELEILVVKKCHRLEQVHSSIGKLKRLVSLDLSDNGSLKELRREVGELEELKELNLDFSGIAKIPTSIGSLRKLEKLSCKGCQSLIELPRSIGDLSSLKKLEITRAPILDLPESIQSLSSLQQLNLWGCDKLRSLPELPFGLTNLTVSCQSLRLPLLSSLSHLEELHLYSCDQLESIPELPSRLVKLYVDSCDKLIFLKLDQSKYLEELSIKSCSSLKRLDLSQLSHLKRLHVEDCHNLLEILGHDELESLEEVVVHCCKSIDKLIFQGLRHLKQFKASSCDNLVEIQGLDRAESLEVLDISNCRSIERLPDLSCFKTLKKFNLMECKEKTLPNLSNVESLVNFAKRCLAGVTKILGVEDLKSLIHMGDTVSIFVKIFLDLSGYEKFLSLASPRGKKLTRLQGFIKLDLFYPDTGHNSLVMKLILLGTSIFRAQFEVRVGDIMFWRYDMMNLIQILDLTSLIHMGNTASILVKILLFVAL